jgi:hypothetical protein
MNTSALQNINAGVDTGKANLDKDIRPIDIFIIAPNKDKGSDQTPPNITQNASLSKRRKTEQQMKPFGTFPKRETAIKALSVLKRLFQTQKWPLTIRGHRNFSVKVNETLINQPFTPPDVKPPTSQRCASKKTTVIGTAESTAAAAKSPHR